MAEGTKFADVEAYSDAELARRYKSTAGSQPAAGPELVASLAHQLDEQGFVIIESLLPKKTMALIREAVMPLIEHDSGRNNFEGFKTQRLYSVIDKTLACNVLAEHPLILSLLDRLLLPNYLLSQLQVINILPGEDQQPVHCDDSFYRVPRPRPPLGAATVWAIDDFTENNGATVVIPGSHRWDGRKPTMEDHRHEMPVVMPSGSVVFFLGTLWHGGGPNRSDAPRLAVSAQYCEPWCRQQENFSLSIPRERVRECSEHVQRMLGYSIYPPFMGFVNGMHPRRLLEDD